jgi:hypothetical protein
MTGKHYNWHKSWSRDHDGHLLHTSGLRVLVIKGDGFTDLETDDASLAIFQARETARGVDILDLKKRLDRLLSEAALWHQRNPSR